MIKNFTTRGKHLNKETDIKKATAPVVGDAVHVDLLVLNEMHTHRVQA